MKTQVIYIIFGFLYLSSCTEAQIENTDIKIRVFIPGDNLLALECENKNLTDPSLWYKGTEKIIATDDDTKQIVRVNNANGNLEITQYDESIYGNYSCKAGNYSSNYRIVPSPKVRLPLSTNVVEGERLHLICEGIPPLSPGIKVIWTFGGKNYSYSNDRVKLDKNDMGVENTVLSIDKIKMDDRGSISCLVVYNDDDTRHGHSGSAETLLRVKDKLAALWPFLGICAEVVVLCGIILVYEKKRNKAELDESDTDQSPDTKPMSNKDSDVRHRK